MKRSIKSQSSFLLPVFVRQLHYIVSQFTDQKKIQIYKHCVKVVKIDLNCILPMKIGPQLI